MRASGAGDWAVGGCGGYRANAAVQDRGEGVAFRRASCFGRRQNVL